MLGKLAQSLGMMLTSGGITWGVEQPANTNAETTTSVFITIILQLVCCAWACACTLSWVAPHDHGTAGQRQTMHDGDVPLVAVV